MKAVSLSRKINVDLKTDVYASTRAGHMALSGDVGPIGAEGGARKIPLDLTLTLDDIDLSHPAACIKGMQIKAGSMSAKTALKGRLQDGLQCRLDHSAAPPQNESLSLSFRYEQYRPFVQSATSRIFQKPYGSFLP